MNKVKRKESILIIAVIWLFVGSLPTVNALIGRPITVSGTITDSKTGEPISGVTVNIYNAVGTKLQTTTTNSLGYYSIRGYDRNYGE